MAHQIVVDRGPVLTSILDTEAALPTGAGLCIGGVLASRSQLDADGSARP